MARSLTYGEIDKAKQQTFLRVYGDLFNKHSGIAHKTIAIKDLKCTLIGRGTILKNDEVHNYERFLPKEDSFLYTRWGYPISPIAETSEKSSRNSKFPVDKIGI